MRLGDTHHSSELYSLLQWPSGIRKHPSSRAVCNISCVGQILCRGRVNQDSHSTGSVPHLYASTISYMPEMLWDGPALI